MLWSLSIRRTVIDGELDLRGGLRYLDDDAVAYWTERIDEAGPPTRNDSIPNGWVVSALQAAWSAIVHSDGFAETLSTAIRIGDDTDTVAAIAGALIGAKWGASAILRSGAASCTVTRASAVRISCTPPFRRPPAVGTRCVAECVADDGWGHDRRTRGTPPRRRCVARRPGRTRQAARRGHGGDQPVPSGHRAGPSGRSRAHLLLVDGLGTPVGESESRFHSG